MTGITNFFENVGRTLDDQNREFRKGMFGPPEKREEFLKSCYHGARFNMGFVLMSTPVLFPGKTPRQVLDEHMDGLLSAAASQAIESGFDEGQTRIYVETHRKAYKSVVEEFDATQ